MKRCYYCGHGEGTWIRPDDGNRRVCLDERDCLNRMRGAKRGRREARRELAAELRRRLAAVVFIRPIGEVIDLALRATRNGR